MINEFNGMCDKLFEILLDSYNMKEWNMSWAEFLGQAEKEIKIFLENTDKTLDK